MVRIAYLSESVVPSQTANSVQVMAMCDALAGIGHDVVLYAVGSDLSPDHDSLHEYYGTVHRFEVRRFGANRNFAARLLYALRIAVHARLDRRAIAYGRSLLGMFVASRLGMPTVTELHYPDQERSRLHRWLVSSLVHHGRSHGVVTITKALRSKIVSDLAMPPDRVLALPDGSREIHGVVPIKLGRSGRPVVGYLGHLYEGRGIGLILALARSCAEIDFHLVGGREEDVSRWKDEAAILENLFLHGHVAPSETPKYLTAFDILLAPYERKVRVSGGDETSQWMSPLKLFEYLAAGKAILCSDIPVLREVMRDGDNCLLCEPGDIAAWREALLRVVGDVELRVRLAEAALLDFNREYSWSVRARKVEALFALKW